MSAAGPDPDPLTCMGRAVRELRVREGLTRERLAACAGCAAGSLSALEAGRLDPTYELLLDIAGCLGVEPTELFDRAAGSRSGRDERRT